MRRGGIVIRRGYRGYPYFGSSLILFSVNRNEDSAAEGTRTPTAMALQCSTYHAGVSQFSFYFCG